MAVSIVEFRSDLITYVIGCPPREVATRGCYQSYPNTFIYGPSTLSATVDLRERDADVQVYL